MLGERILFVLFKEREPLRVADEQNIRLGPSLCPLARFYPRQGRLLQQCVCSVEIPVPVGKSILALCVTIITGSKVVALLQGTRRNLSGAGNGTRWLALLPQVRRVLLGAGLTRTIHILRSLHRPRVS
jgi:hypothetical protein